MLKVINHGSAGKKIVNARASVDKNKFYALREAINLLKELTFVKFDETLDIAIKLGVDPRHSDQMVRGMVSLPNGLGKAIKVAVICRDDKVEEAKAAGADLAGLEIIEEVKSGKIAFDVCIASPDVMGLIGQIAKILGPRGLMPNPKLGTVTTDISSAVQNAKKGQVEFRTDKGGIIHAGVGKLSFVSESLEENIMTLMKAIINSKPTGAKGTYVKEVYLTTTMGPAIKLDTSILLQMHQGEENNVAC